MIWKISIYGRDTLYSSFIISDGFLRNTDFPARQQFNGVNEGWLGSQELQLELLEAANASVAAVFYGVDRHQEIV